MPNYSKSDEEGSVVDRENNTAWELLFKLLEIDDMAQSGEPDDMPRG